MPRFTITVARPTYYTHNFEASNSEEAKKTALEAYAQHGSEAFDCESSGTATAHVGDTPRDPLTEDVVSNVADFLAELVDCYSVEGEFNSFSAPLGTAEIREKATRLAKTLGVQFPVDE